MRQRRRRKVVNLDDAARCWCIGGLGFRKWPSWFLRRVSMAGPLQIALEALVCMPNRALLTGTLGSFCLVPTLKLFRYLGKYYGRNAGWPSSYTAVVTEQPMS